MRYLLNIGNTHTQFGIFEDNKVQVLENWDSPALGEGVLAACLQDYESGHEVAVACVVPKLRKELEICYGRKIHFVDIAAFPEIDFSGYDVSTLGADRIANAGAAFSLYRGPVMVVDCGTAITTEVIDGKGRFLGGAILPGRKMLRRGLHVFTAQLPEVPMRSTKPGAVGSCTTQAIFAGVDLGVLGSVKEVMRAVRRQPGFEDCKIVAVGGDARYFVDHIDALEHGHENLTLWGLAMARLENQD